MAIKKTKKLKPGKGKPKKTPKDIIFDVHIDEKGEEQYLKYSIATIEDRAVTGAIDGLKPVMRRALWATHEMGLTSGSKADKSAKVVGRTLGDYHPHGDSACYGAIVEAANLPMPIIDGKGNFGTMIDPGFAAMRYTNMRLSRYGEKVFFDKFYLPTIEMIPNYDDSKKEPLNLPALLPNNLVNGSFGICPGVNTRIPAHTVNSIIDVLKRTIKAGGECTTGIAMKLVPISKYGGSATAESDAEKLERKRFYKTGIGSYSWRSESTTPDKNNSVRFYRFAPFAKDLSKLLDKVGDIRGVVAIEDDSEQSDPFNAAFRVRFAKTLKGKDLKNAIKQVGVAFSASERMDVKVTDRVLIKGDGKNKEDEVKISLRSATVPQLLTEWVTNRIALEKKACAYWIGKREERIAYLKLMIHAIKHLDIIFKALKKKDTAAYMVKHLKITAAQAESILSLQVRRLKSLEINTLTAEIDALNKEIAGYKQRIKKPTEYILGHLDELKKFLKAESARQEFFV